MNEPPSLLPLTSLLLEAGDSSSPAAIDDNDDDSGDNDEQAGLSLANTIQMNNQQQSERPPASSQTGWTGVNGKETSASVGDCRSQMGLSIASDGVDHSPGVQSISYCGSIVEVRSEGGIRVGICNQIGKHEINNIGDAIDRRQPLAAAATTTTETAHRVDTGIAYSRSINNDDNIETFDETNEHNNEQQPALPSSSVATSSQSSRHYYYHKHRLPQDDDYELTVEDAVEHLYCCACSRRDDRLGWGPNLTTSRSEGALVEQVRCSRRRRRRRRCSRSYRATRDCIETAPHTRPAGLEGAESLSPPPQPKPQSCHPATPSYQWWRLYRNNAYQSLGKEEEERGKEGRACESATGLPSDFCGGSLRSNPIEFLVALNDCSGWRERAITNVSRKSSKKTKIEATDAACDAGASSDSVTTGRLVATSVEFDGNIVQIREPETAISLDEANQPIAVAISNSNSNSGQLKPESSVLAVDNNNNNNQITNECHARSELANQTPSLLAPARDPWGCSSLRGIVASIKSFASSLVVSIREPREELTTSGDSCGHKRHTITTSATTAHSSTTQSNPNLDSSADLESNLTTKTTTTRQQQQQEQTTNLSLQGASSLLIDDKTNSNQSSPLEFVLVARNSVVKVVTVRRGGGGSISAAGDGGKRLVGVQDRTRRRVLVLGELLGDLIEPDDEREQLNGAAYEHHCDDEALESRVLPTASSTSIEQLRIVAMKNTTSGNEVPKPNKERQQLDTAPAKMASNTSSIGNINTRQQQQSEQEPAALRAACNKTPSQQQIRQKHFSSMRSDDRRSTNCSSLGAMTATDLNCGSSISSGGLNYCTDLISHHHQHQHNHHYLHQHNLQPDRQTTTVASVVVASGGGGGGRGEGLMREPNEGSCIALRGQSGECPSGSSSLTSMEQTRVTPAAPSSKPANPCRITFIPNNQKPRSAPKHVHSKPLKKRDIWDKNIEFLLAVIGFAVDLGNIWRFPYICYKNGGGAFLIPYTIMFILGGLPIFYLEMSLGQYFSSGCLTVWRRVCPMAKGIGYAMCLLNFFTGLYYNTIISWAVFFFVESFTSSPLPWTSCNNLWNSDTCKTIEQRQEMRKADINNSSSGNSSNEHFSSPTRDYFEREVLQIHLSKGIDDLGSIRTPLAVYLAIVFVCIYFAIWKGVKSTGKAVWITALLPYFVLIPLLVRGVLLEGSSLGINYYLYPDWYKILDVKVWIDAAKQIYFSLGPGFGTLMALSSYNRFNHNCRRDALIAAAVNYFASFIAGLVIFAVLGYMATIGRIDIDKVATEGPGLVFQVYPEGLATMRFSAMWSVLFFMMVITLGIDSTFGGLESVITGLCDEYPRVLRAHRGIFIGLLIIIIYICSLPTTTYGGNYVIGLIESYGTSVSLLFIVTIETIIVCWLYGADKFCNNLKEMYGEMPGAYWRICWKYISPTILILIFIAACVEELGKYRMLQIDDYTYPGWAPTVGLLMTGSSVCCVPIYAIYYLKTKTSGSFYERLKSGSTPKGPDESDEKDFNNTNIDTDI